VQYLFDLGACFDIPTDAIIQTFDCVQDSLKTIYLVFAYTRDGARSNAVVAKPFDPAVLQAGVKLPAVAGSWSFGLAKRIFMVIEFP
jgi:hypothetical protein